MAGIDACGSRSRRRTSAASDTTGAGDAFDAGFLVGWFAARATGRSLQASLQRATLAGHRAAARQLTPRARRSSLPDARRERAEHTVDAPRTLFAMVRLSLTFYMGSALIPVAKRLAETLSERMDVPVDFDEDASDGDRRGRPSTNRRPESSGCAASRPWCVRTMVGSLRDRRGTGFSSRVTTRRCTTPSSSPAASGLGPVSRISAGRRSRSTRLVRGRATTLSAHISSAAGSGSGSGAGPSRPARTKPRSTRCSEATPTSAAIDETVWAAMIGGPRAATLRVIERTAPQPAPPFSIVDGLESVSTRRSAKRGDRVRSGLKGIAPASDADYDIFRENLADSRRLDWQAAMTVAIASDPSTSCSTRRGQPCRRGSDTRRSVASWT